MNARSLDGFDFVDCYFHEFAVHPHLSSVTLKTDAYFPEYVSDDRRKLDVLVVTLERITRLQADIRPSFSTDLKANEVYEMKLDVVGDTFLFLLTSDYLNLSIECQQVYLGEASYDDPQ